LPFALLLLLLLLLRGPQELPLGLKERRFELITIYWQLLLVTIIKINHIVIEIQIISGFLQISSVSISGGCRHCCCC
jgi:hypothetical protein